MQWSGSFVRTWPQVCNSCIQKIKHHNFRKIQPSSLNQNTYNMLSVHLRTKPTKLLIDLDFLFHSRFSIQIHPRKLTLTPNIKHPNRGKENHLPNAIIFEGRLLVFQDVHHPPTRSVDHPHPPASPIVSFPYPKAKPLRRNDIWNFINF